MKRLLFVPVLLSLLCGCTSVVEGNRGTMAVVGTTSFPMTMLEGIEMSPMPDGATVVHAGRHQVVIRDDKVVLNEIDDRALPRGTRRLSIDRNTSGITVAADGKPLISQKD